MLLLLRVPLIHRCVGGGDKSNEGWCTDDDDEGHVSDDDEFNSFLVLAGLLLVLSTSRHDDGKVDLWQDWKKRGIRGVTMVDAAMVTVVMVHDFFQVQAVMRVKWRETDKQMGNIDFLAF